ncbi:MAG: DUF932 domain-containing protein [Phycisphaeraceae bacterium]
MAPNLMIEEDRVAMMYVGKPPWHGLGKQLDTPATAAQAIEAAGLDWEVTTVPVYAVQDRHAALVPDRLAVVRADRWGKPGCPVYGVVGRGYRPLQNSQAFSFMDSLIGDKAAVYHTAGALGQGERVWILAKLPDQIRVVADDLVEKYLLLSTGHDGHTSVQVMMTPIRVVCQNTLTMALASGSTQLRIAHTRDMPQRLEHARAALAHVRLRYAAVQEGFQRFARVSMKGNRLDSYLRMVFPDPPANAQRRLGDRVRMDRAGAANRFETGAGNDLAPVRDTLWAAYNGVTDYVDHGRCCYQGADRLCSIWFGRGSDIKAKAYDNALLLAQNWTAN